MNEYIVKYNTFGGNTERINGSMLVEAEDIIKAEKIAKTKIIDDGGYPAITDFEIKPL